ncbi:MAG: two-component regulator propeller domain-containing protein, partial [Planctomycetota bacterium]
EETGFLHVRSLLEDRAGNLWIGNNGLGVLFYDGETTINFTEQNKLSRKDTQAETPSLHRVFSMAEDQMGNIWFGTVEYGVWRYDGESLTNFSAPEGLPSKHVWAIYEDKRGELWVGGADPSSVSKFNGVSFDRMF